MVAFSSQLILKSWTSTEVLYRFGIKENTMKFWKKSTWTVAGKKLPNRSCPVITVICKDSTRGLCLAHLWDVTSTMVQKITHGLNGAQNSDFAQDSVWTEFHANFPSCALPGEARVSSHSYLYACTFIFHHMFTSMIAMVLACIAQEF
jgi:hypothetical protein